MRGVERLADHEIEHRVAEELEPLVAAIAARLVRVRGVRERDEHALAIAEFVAQRAGEHVDRIGRGRRADRRVAARAHAAAPAIQPPPSTTSPW